MSSLGLNSEKSLIVSTLCSHEALHSPPFTEIEASLTRAEDSICNVHKYLEGSLRLCHLAKQ